MRFSPVRFIPGFVVSTGLVSAFAESNIQYSLHGFHRPVPFTALGLKRDPSCSEYEWAYIVKEQVPRNSKVIEYLIESPDHPQVTIRCEIPFLDWSLLSGRLSGAPMRINLRERTITVRGLLNTCKGYPCGPARKIFEELEARTIPH